MAEGKLGAEHTIAYFQVTYRFKAQSGRDEDAVKVKGPGTGASKTH